MNRKTIIKNSLFALVLLIVVMVVIFSINDFKLIIESFRTIKLEYIGYASILIIMYWIFWALSLFFILKKYKSKLSDLDNFLISSCDLFFNGITPFSTGGQPFQIYFMHRGGMRSSEATSAVMSKMIIYQIAIIFLGALALFIGYKRVSDNNNVFTIFVIVGFLINLLILIVLILTSTSIKIKNLVLKAFYLLGKIKILTKFVSAKYERFEAFLEEFQASFIMLFKNPLKLYISLFFQTISLLIMYFIPILFLKSLNIEISNNEIIYIISLSSLNYTFMSYIPTPGASLGAEFGFQTLLLTVSNVTSNIAVTVVLLWRFFTYYLSMLYGFVSYLILEHRLNKL